MRSDMTLHDKNWREEIPDVETLTEKALEKIRNHPEIALRLNYAPDTEVSITLSNDDFIRKLNRDYRDKDKATNVLSFPMIEEDETALPQHEDIQTVSYGDIVMAYETISKEASEQKKTIRNHYTHLLVHGFLHLLHFDHEQERQAMEMERLEAEILSAMNIKNPYETI